MDVTGAVVPQVMIQSIEGVREINVATAIHDVESLIGMCVVETQPVFGNCGRGGTSHGDWERSHQRYEDAKSNPSRH